MNKRIKKLIIISLSVIIIVVIAIVITAKILFTPQRVTRTVVAAASDILNREVQIENAHLGFARIILEGIEVENKSAAEKLFVCKRIEAKFKILPLFKKQLHINKLLIRSPRINLDNKFNIDMQHLMTVRMASMVKGGHTKFAINKLDLQDANINFYPPVFPAVSLQNIDIKLEGDSISEPMNLTVRLNPGLKFIEDIDLDATLNIVKDETFINHFILEGRGGRLDLKGDIAGLFSSPKVDLKYEYGDFPGRLKEGGFLIEGGT